MKPVYLLVIAFYIVLLQAVSFFVTRRKSASSDAYLLASRGLSVPLVSALIAGTWTGGVSVVGMAQGAYLHGLSALWFQAGIWMAMFITAFILPRIVTGGKTYSILDIVNGLYGGRTARLAGFAQLVFSVWIVTMQVVGGGAILSFILRGHVSFAAGMCLTALVFVAYNVMGGLVATAYTNLVHLAATVIGIFLGGFYAIAGCRDFGGVAGGYYFTLFGNMGPVQAVSLAYINITLGVLAQPVINTASSASSMKGGRTGIIIGNLITVPIVAMAALCGIVAKCAFPSLPSLSALPSLLDIVPPYVGPFLLLAMWAPLMSAGSPFLMGATTLAVKGYIAPALRIRNDRRLLLASRLTTLTIGLIALLLGFFVKEILRETAWLAVLMSAVVYVVFLGWWRRISPVWAFASLLGAVVLLFVSAVTGLDKLIHPVWPVTALVFMLMGAGALAARRATSRSSAG
jgi:SSS family solute:Na+ symporter